MLPVLDVNTLYYGDNLEVLRRYVPNESIDLIYLDPPFQSGRSYNVLFEEKSGKEAAAQIKAFEDTWHWDQESARTFDSVVSQGGKVGTAMEAFRQFLGDNEMLAYLSMMAPRLIELHRVLKPAGSLYLHCDPTASHYLKLMLDAIFGPKNFRNEIIWRRTRAHNDKKIRRYGSIHDTLLFYSKGDDWLFNPQYQERDEKAPKTHDLYVHTDGKLYRKDNCLAPGGRGPEYEWNGHTKNWRYSPAERDRLLAEGKIVYSKSGMPRVLRPVDPSRGSPLQDLWIDIDPPNSGSDEILNYPTQKPLALLKRIIMASSNEGDVILDPFCGCGTAIEASQELKREWIGIDITHLAIGLIKHRLMLAFGVNVSKGYKVIGEPTDLSGAEQLAREDRHQFEHWALGLVGARASAKGKGKDRGIDGILTFQEGPSGSPHQKIMISVKSGKTSSKDVRDLRAVVEREKAAIGVFITLQHPSKDMRTEAAGAGFYTTTKTPTREKFPRLQIFTIEELLNGKGIDAPKSAHYGGSTVRQHREVQRKLFD